MGERVNKSWRVDIGTGSSSSGRLSAVPIVADGKVFTLDAGGTVSAFSASGGCRVWSTSVTPKNEKRAEGFGGGLALDSGRLYVTTGYGTVVGIDPGKGSVLWTQKIGEPVRSSPTAAGGKVYFVSTDSVLHCLDGNDGQELWTAKGVPEPAILLSNVSPAVGQGVVVAAFPAGDIAAYQVGSGQPAWRDTLSRTSETTAAGILADPSRPVIDRGVVFVVGHGGRMIAVSESSGERLWTRNVTSTQMPWSAGDAVFVVDVNGKLMALARARRQGALDHAASRHRALEWAGSRRRQAVGGIDGGLARAVEARSGQVASTTPLGAKVFVSPSCGWRPHVYLGRQRHADRSQLAPQRERQGSLHAPVPASCPSPLPSSVGLMSASRRCSTGSPASASPLSTISRD